MLNIKVFEFNAFAENTYVAFDESGEGVVIDPGCYDKREQDELVDFISKNSIRLKYLLNTHCHVDHVLGNYFVKEKFKIPLIIHRLDEPVLKSVKVYAPSYGFTSYTEALPDKFIEEGDTITFGNTAFQILFLPGHAPGHVGFYDETSQTLISGDVLFESSIGRTDLPGGNFETLINSIHKKVFTLPDAVTVYPGHGNTTTVGEEKVSNPFCGLSARYHS